MWKLHVQPFDYTGERESVGVEVREDLSAESVMFNITAIYDGPRCGSHMDVMPVARFLLNYVHSP